jgi:hypothetical protein
MTHISGFERSQLLLVPEVIDDYIVVDNPVRFIDTFVFLPRAKDSKVALAA